jgi:alkylation response protein AidB-like acyl-CoA dehydrogenase
VNDAGDEAFRAQVEGVLAGFAADGRLHPDSGGVSVIMGAGNDDLEAGRAYLAALASSGLAVPTWPVDYGGLGATADQAAVVGRELSRYQRPDLYPFGVGLSLVGPTLLTHGTVEQCIRWLPAIRTGAEIWCQLFSEPDAGSDLAALTTRAVRDGDLWRINGSKVWSSRAHYAQWGLLLARTDPDVPKHAGITAFAIDMAGPGVEVRPLRQMNGDTHFNQVFMDGATVPDRDRIGDVNKGWGVAITTLMHERGAIGGGGAGGLGTVADLLAVARSSTAAPGSSSVHVMRDRAAALYAQLEVARWTGQRSRAAAQAGRPPGPEGSGAKLRLSANVKELGNLGIDAAGPAGVAGEGWADRQTLFLTGPSLSIRGGTDEIQRNIIGERVLGLPPEPRVDKDRPFRER